MLSRQKSVQRLLTGGMKKWQAAPTRQSQIEGQRSEW